MAKVPVSPFDNEVAIDQMETAYTTLLGRSVANSSAQSNAQMSTLALDGRPHPRIVSLGGDHTIVCWYCTVRTASFICMF